MEETKKLLRTKKGPREYSYLGCPLTRNRSAWCFRLCAPDGKGHGRCGRIAPHSLKSSIQNAIEAHNKKQFENRLQDMEQAYLDDATMQLREPAIRISHGEADIVLKPAQDDLRSSGSLLDSVCFRLMNDAAANAVGSLMTDGSALAAEFSVTLTHAKPTGDIFVRGRFVGRTGENYLAETMLTDSGGTELGRGEGVFFNEPAKPGGA